MEQWPRSRDHHDKLERIVFLLLRRNKKAGTNHQYVFADLTMTRRLTSRAELQALKYRGCCDKAHGPIGSQGK